MYKEQKLDIEGRLTMEMFKKYIPHISLGVGVFVVLCLFLESVTITVGSNNPVSIWGLSAAFGSSGTYEFGFNYALTLAYLLPLVAGLLHFFTTKLSHAKIYQYASIGLFLLSAVLFFSVPALFESITGNFSDGTIWPTSSYAANYGFGSIFAGVFLTITAIASLYSTFIIE